MYNGEKEPSTKVVTYDDKFLCTEAAVSETRSTQNIQPVYEQISAAFSSVNGLLVRGVR